MKNNLDQPQQNKPNQKGSDQYKLLLLAFVPSIFGLPVVAVAPARGGEFWTEAFVIINIACSFITAIGSSKFISNIPGRIIFIIFIGLFLFIFNAVLVFLAGCALHTITM